MRKKMDFDLPPVARTLAPLDEARRLASRHQRHDAVMNGLQALGQLRDSRPMTPRHALDMQQHQILNGGDVLRAQYRFGDVQKAPKLIAEFGQSLEIRLRQGVAVMSVHGSPDRSVSYSRGARSPS